MMHVISLWQPWASLMNLGLKTIETRSWPTNHLGVLGIHATKAEPKYIRESIENCVEGFPGDEEWWEIVKALAKIGGTGDEDDLNEAALATFDALPRGSILGTVEMFGCKSTHQNRKWIDELSVQERAFGNYEMGRFGWLTRNPRPFAEPIPSKGKQGIWQWDPADSNAVEPVKASLGGLFA